MHGQVSRSMHNCSLRCEPEVLPSLLYHTYTSRAVRTPIAICRHHAVPLRLRARVHMHMRRVQPYA